jgi:DUF971 family protein
MLMRTPTDVTLNQRTGELIITWPDGRVCHYPLDRLRLACPCAECRGGHEQMGPAFDPPDILHVAPTRPYQVEQVVQVGNYALQFFWDDGHHAGIYTWDYLYRLCPAEQTDA